MYLGSDIKAYKKILFELSINKKNDRYKLLAIDYGTRRIGLALSDEFKKFAVPFQTIIRKSLNDDLSAILLAISNNNIKGVVIGKPILNNNVEQNKVNKSLQAVLSFSHLLAKFLNNNNRKLPILLYDERYSSVMAKKLFDSYYKRMKILKSRKKHTKIELDKIAAYVILQDVLDQLEEIKIQKK